MFESVTRHLHGEISVAIVTADARRFVRATGDRYDVIVAGLFHPSRNGAAAAGHFAKANDILNRLIAVAPDRNEARSLQSALQRGKR